MFRINETSLFEVVGGAGGGVTPADVETLLSALTGQFIGDSATFAGLPVADLNGRAPVNGDWGLLTADDGGNLSGLYTYDGAAYVFTSALGSAGSTIVVTDNLTSTATDEALSANQGKVLKDEQDIIRTLTGTSSTDTNLGNFTGTTITDGVDIKVALQEIETAIEAVEITGQYLGSAATFALLPTGTQASNGDYAILTVIDGGNDRGIYLYDGTVFTFAVALADDLLLADTVEALAGTDTAKVMSPARTKEAIEDSVNARLFISLTNLLPAIPSAPTLSEVQAYATANFLGDVIAVYTGTDLQSDTITYTYHIDKNTGVTLLKGPVTSNNIQILNGLSNPIAWDANLGESAVVDISGDYTLSNITNPVDGQVYHITVNPSNNANRYINFSSKYVTNNGEPLSEQHIGASDSKSYSFIYNTEDDRFQLVNTVTDTTSVYMSIPDTNTATIDIAGCNYATIKGALGCATMTVGGPDNKISRSVRGDEYFLTMELQAADDTDTTFTMATYWGNEDETAMSPIFLAQGTKKIMRFKLNASGAAYRIGSDVVGGEDRVHLTNTLVASVLPGEPTLAEITLAVGTTNKNRVVYFTGTDVATDTPTYVYFVDASDNVTLLLNPISNTAPISITPFVPVITGSTTIGFGNGQVNPVEWNIVKFGTFVKVMGRFDWFQEDDPVTIEVPAGTFTSVSTAISTRAIAAGQSHVGIRIIDNNHFTIDRDNNISGSDDMAVLIEGIGTGVASADMVGVEDRRVTLYTSNATQLVNGNTETIPHNWGDLVTEGYESVTFEMWEDGVDARSQAVTISAESFVGQSDKRVNLYDNTSVYAWIAAMDATSNSFQVEVNVADAYRVRIYGVKAQKTVVNPDFVDILDEDDMISDRADAVASQQSVKKYVDDNAGGLTPRGTLDNVTPLGDAGIYHLDAPASFSTALPVATGSQDVFLIHSDSGTSSTTQQGDITNSGGSWSVGVTPLWQAFNAADTGFITSLEFNFVASIAGVIEIYEGSGIGGTLISTENIVGQAVTLISPVAVTAGGTYTISLTSATGGSWKYGNSGFFTGEMSSRGLLAYWKLRINTQVVSYSEVVTLTVPVGEEVNGTTDGTYAAQVNGDAYFAVDAKLGAWSVTSTTTPTITTPVAQTALATTFDNVVSGLTATNVKTAIEELATSTTTVVNNFASTSTTDALSAGRGKVLRDTQTNAYGIIGRGLADNHLGIFSDNIITNNTNIKTALQDLSTRIIGLPTAKQSVVADIAARDALPSATAGDLCYVIDASADATVVLGAALYVRDAAWNKISEFESMDLDLTHIVEIFEATHAYKVKEVIQEGNKLYSCSGDFTSGAVFNDADWKALNGNEFEISDTDGDTYFRVESAEGADEDSLYGIIAEQDPAFGPNIDIKGTVASLRGVTPLVLDAKGGDAVLVAGNGNGVGTGGNSSVKSGDGDKPGNVTIEVGEGVASPAELLLKAGGIAGDTTTFGPTKIVTSNIQSTGVVPVVGQVLTLKDIATGETDYEDLPAVPVLLDEDDMLSDSNTQASTQQSVKAYVDSRAGYIINPSGDFDFDLFPTNGYQVDTVKNADTNFNIPTSMADAGIVAGTPLIVRYTGIDGQLNNGIRLIECRLVGNFTKIFSQSCAGGVWNGPVELTNVAPGIIDFIIGDWSNAGGLDFIDTLQATHGIVNPNDVQVWELISGAYHKIEMKTVIAASGAVLISMPDSPDEKFAGRIVIR